MIYFLRIIPALMPAWVYAAETPSSPIPPPVTGLMQVLFGLAVVLLVIIGVAHLIRRVSHTMPSNRLRVVSAVMLGGKERVVVVEMDDEWLVLGVTPHQVNLLSKLPRPTDAAQTLSVEPFVSRLRRFIDKNRR